MSNNKIPTAEEFIEDYYPEDIAYSKEQVRRMLSGFTRLHVKAALKAAAENAEIDRDEGWITAREHGNVDGGTYTINQPSIQS